MAVFIAHHMTPPSIYPTACPTLLKQRPLIRALRMLIAYYHARRHHERWLIISHQAASQKTCMKNIMS
jgi:hypothetical protein